jgi:hypothetical protein
MELLLMLELVYIWRLQRESQVLKVEPDPVRQENELLEVSYPKGDNE